MNKLIDTLLTSIHLKGKLSMASGVTSEQRSTIVYSRLLVITIALFAINLIQDLFTENYAIWGVDIIMILAVSGLRLLLNKFPLLSKLLGFTSMNFAIFYFMFVTGNRTQVGAVFFSIIACAFLVFGSKNFWIGVAFSVLSFTLIVSYEIYYSSTLPLTANYDLGGTLINLFSAYGILVIIIIVLTKVNILFEQNLLEEKRKLQLANDELDRFVYSMSHDLRAPLSSIKGLVNIAQKETDVTQLMQYFPMIEDRVNKLGSFTEDVTNYARNIRTEIKEVEVNLLEVVNEAWSSLLFSDGSSKIKLVLDFDANDTILIDKIRLKIIVNNLLSNAIKYQDFTKTESERYLKIRFYQSKESYQLVFEDNGIGIQEDQLSLMFTMFHRASYQAQGSGLGLFIVKQITEKLGGTIELKSILGKGTTFTILLGKKPFAN